MSTDRFYAHLTLALPVLIVAYFINLVVSWGLIMYQGSIKYSNDWTYRKHMFWANFLFQPAGITTWWSLEYLPDTDSDGMNDTMIIIVHSAISVAIMLIFVAHTVWTKMSKKKEKIYAKIQKELCIIPNEDVVDNLLFLLSVGILSFLFWMLIINAGYSIQFRECVEDMFTYDVTNEIAKDNLKDDAWYKSFSYCFQWLTLGITYSTLQKTVFSKAYIALDNGANLRCDRALFDHLNHYILARAVIIWIVLGIIMLLLIYKLVDFAMKVCIDFSLKVCPVDKYIDAEESHENGCCNCLNFFGKKPEIIMAKKLDDSKTVDIETGNYYKVEKSGDDDHVYATIPEKKSSIV